MGKIVNGVANDYDCEQYEDWNKHLRYCQSNEPIILTRWQDPTIEEYQKEIARLNNLINTIFDFSFFKEECPLNFGFSDENEEKSQDVFYEDDYCEKNCNDEYKKCWLKYFERLQELKKEGK